MRSTRASHTLIASTSPSLYSSNSRVECDREICIHPIARTNRHSGTEKETRRFSNLHQCRPDRFQPSSGAGSPRASDSSGSCARDLHTGGGEQTTEQVRTSDHPGTRAGSAREKGTEWKRTAAVGAAHGLAIGTKVRILDRSEERRNPASDDPESATAQPSSLPRLDPSAPPASIRAPSAERESNGERREEREGGGGDRRTHFCLASMSRYFKSRSVCSGVCMLTKVVAIPVLPARPVRPH